MKELGVGQARHMCWLFFRIINYVFGPETVKIVKKRFSTPEPNVTCGLNSPTSRSVPEAKVIVFIKQIANLHTLEAENCKCLAHMVVKEQQLG